MQMQGQGVQLLAYCSSYFQGSKFPPVEVNMLRFLFFIKLVLQTFVHRCCICKRTSPDGLRSFHLFSLSSRPTLSSFLLLYSLFFLLLVPAAWALLPSASTQASNNFLILNFHNFYSMLSFQIFSLQSKHIFIYKFTGKNTP